MFYKNAVRLLLAINNHRAINYVTINTLVHSYSALTLAHYRFKIHISLSMDQEICLKKHNALKKKFYKATQRNKAITKRSSVGTLVTLKAMSHYQNSGQGSRQKIQLLTN